MEIIKGKIQSAQKVVIYGPEGIGKTTFASHFPKPIFIDTEGSTKHLDVSRLPDPDNWNLLMDEVRHIKENGKKAEVRKLCSTLVIDTADWAEQMCNQYVCDKYKKKGIEDFGYGKGYIYSSEEFRKLLNMLDDVIDMGINVVLTAHAKMRKFEQPDELGAYDRWEMKLGKQAGPMLKEWADMVLFANYKTYVINVDGQGAEKGKNKAQGGSRVMYTSHHPCWDAKNRHGLAEEIPFEFQQIAYCIPVFDSLATDDKDWDRNITKEEEPQETKTIYSNSNIPQDLFELMQINNINEEQIQRVVSERGYYPEDTPISNYDPQFVTDVLVGAWTQVLKEINDRLPF